MSFVLLIVGFGLLIKGADWLVEGATNLARRMGISTLVVGLTVVAFGTSLPEMVVSVIAAHEDETALALSNILGSNFANVALIIGCCAAIRPLTIESSTIWKEIPFALAAIVLVAILSFDSMLGDGATSTLSARDGWVLLIFFATFLFYVFSVGMRTRKHFFSRDEFTVATSGAHMRWLAIIRLVLIGMLMVFIGGRLVVHHAVLIAQSFGFTESFIAITVIAFGTTLPEFITTLIATLKKQDDVAIGNVIGSITFNALFILGVASQVRPLIVDPTLWIDALSVIGVTTLLWIFAGRAGVLARTEGIILLVTYGGYIVFVLQRQGLIAL